MRERLNLRDVAVIIKYLLRSLFVYYLLLFGVFSFSLSLFISLVHVIRHYPFNV